VSSHRNAPAARALVAAAVLGALLAALAAPGDARAQTAARKAGRGLAAMTCGFLEVPGNIVEEWRRNGALQGITVGFALGLGKLVARELIGVYEFVSAPFPAPPDFRPILDPEFPWGYFESRNTH